ncbi:AAEL007157-PA, partial [Aedes aegypti]
LSRCRECGRSAASRLKDSDTIFCRFIAFRKLRYNTLGHMEVAGFADPHQDAQKPDISLWDANLSKVPIDLSVEKSKFLLGQVGYKFCELFHQEKEAYFEHMSEDKTIAWKQAVNGVREMCDVCSTTLFNYHWVCSTCGFVVCIDCYKVRYSGISNNFTRLTIIAYRDCYMWLHCTNREPHVQNKLMLTQIIPANSLYKLVRQMHGVCALLEIPLNCECPLSKESLFRKIKDRLEFIFPITIEKHLSEKYSESESLIDFTAEFQVQHSNIQSFLNDFLSEFVFLTGQNSTDNLTDDVQIMEYNRYMKKGIEFQNKGERVMTLKESEKLYPNVAHQWLCNGRLLRLLDPLSDNNYNTFHDQWERGQPVMVSYVSDKLDMSLWRPESFIREFGDIENDLINCLNGKLVRGQKMKVFWEGFDRIAFRLMDERDRPMMLKLKDWPPGDDFAEMMPTRFNDLMNNLPLSEYTRREGRLNLASRLSSFFVRPDLGPKMYSAYGSALHPTKGTTNLHLDVSDAVNVMVYTAVPKDVERTKYVQKVLDAIDSDECDVFTRQRIRDKADLPGALWHIYHAKDADKIRSLLHKIEVERGISIKANHDPIHDQKWYLDANLRKRLLQEYNVEGYSIVQCSGDAIFIPAGAPHQVRNLHNCVKVAEDFVSPENISYCFKLTNEFRHLTNTHSNHEDKLQIKNIIYHTVKDAVSCLT